MFSWLTGNQEKVNWKQVYEGPKDLPSLNQMIGNNVQFHLNQKQGKYMQTTDKQTIGIVEKMFQNNKFIKQHLLGNPGQKTDETESLKVKICNINNNPKAKTVHQLWKSKGKSRIVAIGGPSAHDQTLMTSLIPAIRQTHDIHFYCRNYLQTNVLHSALQSHARHGNALNADPILSGRHLLPLIFKRFLFGVPLEEVMQRDFIKIDVKLNNFAYVIEYVKNQFNGIKQIWKSWRGQQNQHDLNRFQSVVSQELQKTMERSTKTYFTSRNQKYTKDSQSMAIHLVFNQNQLKDIIEQHKQHQKVKGIKIQEVSSEELKELFPQAQNILKGYRYLGDYATKVNIYELEKQKATELGAVWSQNKTLSKVYVDKDSKGQPFACGVEFTDGQIVPADKIHLTLGYKAGYFYEDTEKRAVKNINIPVAGVSTNLILQKTPAMKNIIDNKGNLQLQITSNNWTIVGSDDKYILLRGTAGGNTGSQAYMPSHFLNLCRNTRSLFGDAFVGILSVYGCPRAVNYKNSTQFCQVADGLVISYGKGGTGNTKRTSQAYKALSYLGLGKQVEQYFSKIAQSRVNIVESMQKIIKDSANVQFYYDYTSQTKRNLFNAYL